MGAVGSSDMKSVYTVMATNLINDLPWLLDKTKWLSTALISPRTSSEATVESPNSPSAITQNKNTTDDRTQRSADLYSALYRHLENSSDNQFDWPKANSYVLRVGSSSLENAINNARFEEFKKRFSKDLLQAIRADPIEPGQIGAADKLVSTCLNQNASATMSWLNDLFISNFHKPSIAADLLLLIGRIPYDVARSVCVTMALAGLSHENAAVQEAAIRAFENWADIENLNTLKAVEVKPKWLRAYLDEVLADLAQLNETTS